MTLLLAVLLAVPARAEEWSARLTEVSGTVLLHVEGDADGLPAEAGTPLQEGDRIETGADSRAEIALEAESVVELGAQTSFTVGSMDKEKSWFTLSVGSFLAKLKSFQNKHSTMRVRTPTAVAAVRGTEFGLEVGDDGGTDVGVFDEGRVAVTHGESGEGGKETLLTAGQEATLAPGEREFSVRRLERLERHRGRVGRLRERREHLRKNWRDIPPEGRRNLREKWRGVAREKLGKMSPENREKLRGDIQERRQRMGERREGLGERLREASPEQRKEILKGIKEKREERREQRNEERREGAGDDQRRKGPGNNGPGGPGGPGMRGGPGGPGGRGPGGGQRREQRGGGKRR